MTTQPTPVRCDACGSLFGMEHDDGAVLTIKSRDIYRTYRGGEVEGPCRKCGAQVRWKAKVR
jgi:hypothetical protein